MLTRQTRNPTQRFFLSRFDPATQSHDDSGVEFDQNKSRRHIIMQIWSKIPTKLPYRALKIVWILYIIDDK
jgi:hypothetical protein